MFSFSVFKNLDLRIGIDNFYTKGNVTLYTSQFDTGIYASLKSYKGQGSLFYLFTSYKWNGLKISLGFSESLKEFSDSMGSGYDKTEGKILDKVELNMQYIL